MAPDRTGPDRRSRTNALLRRLKMMEKKLMVETPLTRVTLRTRIKDETDVEYRRQLAAKAMDSMRHVFPPSIWQAFWKTAVDGRPAQDVGLELKMTPGAVYVAKCRVLIRLREEVQRLQAEAEAW